MSSIPLADGAVLQPARRRTALARAGLAAVVLLAIVAAALVARDPGTETIVQLPAGSTAIVVLDVSASISADTYSRIGTTLSGLASQGGRYGLVVFSDQAYEALPPDSPAADLKPLIRYFRLPARARPGEAPQFPPNPWARSFTAGTKISSGLDLAHGIAVEGRLHKPAVVLVSDLDDDPQDLQRLGVVLLAYRRDRIPVQIVALDASAEDLALFTRILGKQGTVPASPSTRVEATRRTRFPWTLVALATIVAVALGAHELGFPRLRWSSAPS
jgi:hypothetical protein